jgi:hypothetical protein
MPTVLGWVDTRRFFVFCWGGGKMAVRGSRGDGDDDDDFTGLAPPSLSHTPPHPSAANDSSGNNNNNNNNNHSSSSGSGSHDSTAVFEPSFDIHMRTSRDSWRGGIPCAPRKVSQTLSNIMSGDEAALGADGRVEEQLLGALRL